MKHSQSLRSLQAAFAQTLLDGEHLPAAGLFRARAGSTRQRLNVYLNHSRIVQGEALQNIYPATRRLVGEDFFANMGVLYGERHPLRSGDLRTFGAHLAAFMQRFEPLAGFPYLPDVARLEWACHESLHAAQASGEARLRESAPLRLAPHVRLLRSPFPFASIWDFALRDHDAAAPRLNIDDAEPCHLLIMRPCLDVEVLTLPEEEWRWLAKFDVAYLMDDAEAPHGRAWVSRGVLAAADEEHRLSRE